MQTNMDRRTRAGLKAGLVPLVLLMPQLGFCQPVISLSPSDGPPGTSTVVTGHGFASSAGIDIYFDAFAKTFVQSDGSGSFSNIKIQVPPSAFPGWHRVRATERSDQVSAKTPFKVETSWSEFPRPNMQRYNQFENVVNAGNVGKLHLKWMLSFVVSSAIYTASSPVIAQGVVYVGTNDPTRHLQAVSASTGARLWSFNLGGTMLFNTPAVANGIVYTGSYDPGFPHLFAVGAKTGAKLWSFATQGWSGPFSSTVVVDGVVYAIQNSEVSGQNSYIYAIKAATGKLCWRYPVPWGGWGAVPAVANGVVYAAVEHNVYALDTSTGALIWTFLAGSNVWSTPAVANGVVYFGSVDHNVYAVDANTGVQLWSYATGDAVRSSPAVANGVVYIGSNDHSVYAINARTGARVWSYATADWVYSSPAVANGVVYVGSYDHNIYALDAVTGAKLWSYTTGRSVSYSSPIIADGVIYVGSDDGNLYAFGL
jgi:outer membrane protein assembly factor BamB